MIHLKSNKESARLCEQPQLVGRLSGPVRVLSKLTCETVTDNDNGADTAVLVGHYHVPFSGNYRHYVQRAAV